ncbi:MAG: TolC family protein [Nitrospirota bacterium]
MVKLIRGIATAAALFLLPCFVAAETLEEGWERALAADNRLLAAKKDVEYSARRLDASEALRFPSLTLESSYTILNQSPAAALDNPLLPFSQIPMSEDKSLSYSASLSLPLFTSGRISSGIAAAASGFRAELRNEMKTVLDLKLRVAESYIAVLRARHLVEVAESNVSSLVAYTRDVANFYDQGMITKNDLLAAQVELSDARQRFFQAENTLHIAKASYNRLTGRPLDGAVTLDELSAEPEKMPLSDLTAIALGKRPELSSLEEQSKALRFQATQARSSVLPQLLFRGSYSYTENRYQVYEDLWSATLGLRWELFDGGSARHNAAALILKSESVEKQRADISSVIALQVRQAFLDLNETLMRIEVTREAMSQAEENLKVVKERYREGVGTNTEVLDAETLRVRSYSNYYNAVYDAVLSGIRLRYATGLL